MVLLTGSHSVSAGSHWHFGVLARDALSTACVPALWSFLGSEIFCGCKKADCAMQGNQYKSGTLCGVLRVIFKGTAEKKKRDPGDFVRQDRRTGMLKEEENTHMNQGSM